MSFSSVCHTLIEFNLYAKQKTIQKNNWFETQDYAKKEDLNNEW